MMIRRIPWRALLLGAVCIVPMGCEPHKSWLRHEDEGDDFMARTAAEGTSSSKKAIGQSDDDQDASTFFKGNRTSGGWSSEAREIESHLGAN